MAQALLVAGVGRSGTSIATQLAVTVGLRPPSARDLMQGNFANPGGYWESTSLATLNDRLLARWSSTWWSPPAEVSPAMVAALASERDHARAGLDSVFGAEPGWVWKDPRLTVLLPFWAELLPDVAVLVPVRDPVAVAHSISRRDGLALDQAVALVERHTRLLLAALAGLAALVARYEQLVHDPATWVRALLDFTVAQGLPARAPALDPAAEVRPPTGISGTGTSGTPLPDELVALHELLVSHVGAHDAFPALALPPEGPGVAAALREVVLPSWLG